MGRKRFVMGKKKNTVETGFAHLNPFLLIARITWTIKRKMFQQRREKMKHIQQYDGHEFMCLFGSDLSVEEQVELEAPIEYAEYDGIWLEDFICEECHALWVEEEEELEN